MTEFLLLPCVFRNVSLFNPGNYTLALNLQTPPSLSASSDDGDSVSRVELLSSGPSRGRRLHRVRRYRFESPCGESFSTTSSISSTNLNVQFDEEHIEFASDEYLRFCARSDLETLELEAGLGRTDAAVVARRARLSPRQETEFRDGRRLIILFFSDVNLGEAILEILLLAVSLGVPRALPGEAAFGREWRRRVGTRTFDASQPELQEWSKLLMVSETSEQALMRMCEELSASASESAEETSPRFPGGTIEAWSAFAHHRACESATRRYKLWQGLLDRLTRGSETVVGSEDRSLLWRRARRTWLAQADRYWRAHSVVVDALEPRPREEFFHARAHHHQTHRERYEFAEASREHVYAASARAEPAPPLTNAADGLLDPRGRPILFKESYVWPSPQGQDLSAESTSSKREEFPACSESQVHLIVLAHGYLGSRYDLRKYQAALSLLDAPHVEVLALSSYEECSHEDIHRLGALVYEEIRARLADEVRPRARYVSFLGFSLGCLVVRAALAAGLETYCAGRGVEFGTFVSLAGPHLGSSGGASKVVAAASWLMMRVKGAVALEQLTLRDDEGRCLRALAESSQALRRFQNIVLITCSSGDTFVPSFSAWIEPPPASHQALSEAHNALAASVCGVPGELSRIDVAFDFKLEPEDRRARVEAYVGKTHHIHILESFPLCAALMVSFGRKWFL